MRCKRVSGFHANWVIRLNRLRHGGRWPLRRLATASAIRTAINARTLCCPLGLLQHSPIGTITPKHNAHVVWPIVKLSFAVRLNGFPNRLEQVHPAHADPIHFCRFHPGTRQPHRRHPSLPTHLEQSVRGTGPVTGELRRGLRTYAFLTAERAQIEQLEGIELLLDLRLLPAQRNCRPTAPRIAGCRCDYTCLIIRCSPLHHCIDSTSAVSRFE